MKIGLLTAHASRRAAGVWSSVERLGRALAETAVEVEIFGLVDLADAVGNTGGRAPQVNLCSVVGSAAFGYAPGLKSALERARLSLLHANGIWMYPSLACLRWSRRRRRRPYVISPHGMLDAWAVRNAAWKKRLAGWWFEDAHLSGAACLHALAEPEARALRSYGLRNPICIVPSGVDLPADGPTAPPAWAAETGGRRVLLFLGRLHPKKGLLDLVRAWAKLQAEPTPAAADWLLVIAGWDQGGHRARLRRLIDELGVARSVRLVGPQFGGAKAASLAFADAFVLPSVSEGLPVAVLEAWSYGLPVLMTEACNLPEGFAAGAALRIAPDPASLAHGLRRLMALSAPDRRAIGARGRRLIQQKFAWPQIARQMSAVYEWVLGGGPAPDHVIGREERR
jgi:poly(glycerol-phosphate) alpha-glucosyltransferase